MLHRKKKFRELFRFFERLSFLIFIKVSEPVRLNESLRREGLPKINSRASERLLKMYLEKNKTALCKNLFFMKILRYTYCKLIK